MTVCAIGCSGEQYPEGLGVQGSCVQGSWANRGAERREVVFGGLLDVLSVGSGVRAVGY